MFNFDVLKNPKPFEMYLCKPDETVVCFLNGIDETSASITLNLNNQLELSFDYARYLDVDGELVMSNGFEDLAYGMKIFVDKVGFFVMNYPPINFNGEKEKKTITATSCDVELENKDLVRFKINIGEEDSLEYLVEYDSGENEYLLSEYTGLPYDYIVFYNTYPEQLHELLDKYDDGDTITDADSILEIMNYCKLIPRLKSKTVKNDNDEISLIEYVIYTYDDSGENVISIDLADNFNARISALITFYTKYHDQLSLLDLAIEKCNCNWEIGEIDSSLCNRKFQFNIDSSNIYSFLTQDVAKASECVVDFDLFNKKINFVAIDNLGEDTDVFIDRRNLLNSLDITCDENSLCTRFNVKGGEDLGIEYVNFGTSRIVDLSYFMSARNEKGELIYVNEELVEKYNQYTEDIEVARDKYIEYTKGYNKSLDDIDEIKYRVPNDEVQNDWDTFSDTELETALTVYNNLLVTCISLYKEDYGSAGCNDDGSVNETYMKNTEYWFDYYAYQIAIEQIEATIVARANGSSYAEIDDSATLAIINAWKTEWSLFGIVELQNKITAYNNQMNVLVDGQAVILQTNSQAAKQWSDLTDKEKQEYGGLSDNYQYSVYNQYYTERNECQDYLDELMAELSTLETVRDTYRSNRSSLVKLVTFEGYDRDALAELVDLEPSTIDPTFTDSEIKVLNLLLVDRDYKNDYIITTSLDTTVTTVDVQYELLNDAKEELSIESQPQISFKADIDNLMCMPEFADYDFRIGNFVYLEYFEGYYVKLRISQMVFNPLIPTQPLTISFTNYIKSNSKRTDLSYILGLASGSRSGGSSGGSSRGSGSFGSSDDIDITISNTMLAKLLNSEMFGTRVSNIILDTIKVNQITAKYAKFDGLAKGTTTIDGQCIKTGVIVSNNYNGNIHTTTPGVTVYDLDNTAGSILDLLTGQFNFGGGKLVWNGTSLNVDGNIIATTLAAGGRTGASTGENGLFIDSSGNLYSGSSNNVIIYNTGQFNFANGGIVYNGSTLNITADAVTIGGSNAATSATLQSAINTLKTTLETQIDKKISTWYQSTDPKLSWESADYDSHVGDLWYYTGTTNSTYTQNATYRFSSSYQWEECEASEELFDKIDGKATIWYGVYRTGTTSSYSPSSTDRALAIGDFIYNSTQSKTYICTNSSTPTWQEFNTTNYPDLGTGDYLVDPYTGSTYKWDGAVWTKMTDYKSEMALYMRFEPDTTLSNFPGLMIANMTSGNVTNGTVTGYNVLIDNNYVNIRHGTSVLARYGSNIELARNGATITIGSTDNFHTVIGSSSMKMIDDEDILFNVFMDEDGSTIRINMGATVKAVGVKYSNAEVEEWVDHFTNNCTVVTSGSPYYVEDDETGSTYIIDVEGSNTYGIVLDHDGGYFFSGKYKYITYDISGANSGSFQAVEYETPYPEVPNGDGVIGLGGTSISSSDGFMEIFAPGALDIKGNVSIIGRNASHNPYLYIDGMVLCNNLTASGTVSCYNVSTTASVIAGSFITNGTLDCSTIGSQSATNALVFRGNASGDCDNITTTGIYYIAGTPLTNGHNATYCPLIVINCNGLVAQFLVRLSAFNVRGLIGSPAKWSEWSDVT